FHVRLLGTVMLSALPRISIGPWSHSLVLVLEQTLFRETRMEPAENMMKDLRAVLADEEVLRATADEAGPKVQEVRARAEESLRAAREHLKSAGGELDSQVRANPWA